MSTVTRRAALSTTAAIASTVAAGGTAVAKAFDHALVQIFDPPELPQQRPPRKLTDPDAELKALGVEFRRLVSGFEELGDEMSALEERFAALKPPMPNTLIVTLDDILNIGPWLGEHCTDGTRRFTGADVAKMREIKVPPIKRLTYLDGSDSLYELKDDHSPQHRADQVIATWDAWSGECEAARHSCGLAQAEKEHLLVYKAIDRVRDRIEQLAATTTAGMRVKAEVLVWQLGEFDQEQSTPQDRIANSLARDLVAQG